MKQKLIIMSFKAFLFTLLAILISATVNEYLLKIIVVTEDFNTIVIVAFIVTLIFSVYFCTMLILNKLNSKDYRK